MEGSRDLLLQSLALSGLIAATLEYAFLLRHRLERRLFDTYIDEAHRAGLCALVRVMLVET